MLESLAVVANVVATLAAAVLGWWAGKVTYRATRGAVVRWWGKHGH